MSSPTLASSDIALDHITREVMADGSKSFSLAARLFDPESRRAARYLYNWCRYCDDQIDKVEDDDAALERLRDLEAQTGAALAGAHVKEAPFRTLQILARTYGIFPHYPFELLEGMRMDVAGVRYRTLEDLELYCYRVAGVVGLMMTHVMGVSSEDAMEYACDMGIAMQMTNIARDLREDFIMGRVYIPEEWFEDLGQRTPNAGKDTKFDSELFALVVERLVNEAERRYANARYGLRYLTIRSALAVAAASAIYRAIGNEVLRRGANAWDERVVISRGRKLMLIIGSSLGIFASIPVRLVRLWRPVRLTAPYRFE